MHKFLFCNGTQNKNSNLRHLTKFYSNRMASFRRGSGPAEAGAAGDARCQRQTSLNIPANFGPRAISGRPYKGSHWRPFAKFNEFFVTTF